MAELGPTRIQGDLVIVGDIKGERWNGVIFENGWGHYGSNWDNVGYTKNSDGIVHLKGLANGGTYSNSDGGTGDIFNLPVGYRPAEYHIFVTISNTAIGRINVFPSGNVVAAQGSAWISLNGICFRAAE